MDRKKEEMKEWRNVVFGLLIDFKQCILIFFKALIKNISDIGGRRSFGRHLSTENHWNTENKQVLRGPTTDQQLRKDPIK